MRTSLLPLSTSKSHILDQGLAIEILAMPKRANTLPKVDFSKRCWYHRNRGHLTKECSILKDKVENLIKLGYLWILSTSINSISLTTTIGKIETEEERGIAITTLKLRDVEAKYNIEKGRKKSLNHSRHVISTIVVGFTGGGAMPSAQKKHLRQVQSSNMVFSPHKALSMLLITFTSTDFKAIDLSSR